MDALRFCFSRAGRVAVVAAWFFAIAIVVFNGLFGILFRDGNLVVRGAPTLVLATPLFILYLRAKRLLRASSPP